MESLIGVDLTIPTDTDMNRNPQPPSMNPPPRQFTADDPAPQPAAFPGMPFKRSTSKVKRREGSKPSIFAEHKDRSSTVHYKLGEEAEIQDMAPYTAEHTRILSRLSENDYVFVRRSGGKFCFATIKSLCPDPEEGIMMELYVNEAGATKSIPSTEWNHYIRGIRGYVLCDPESCVMGLGETVGQRISGRSGGGDEKRRSNCPEMAQDDVKEGKSERHRGRSRRATQHAETQQVEERKTYRHRREDSINIRSNSQNLSRRKSCEDLQQIRDNDGPKNRSRSSDHRRKSEPVQEASFEEDDSVVPALRRGTTEFPTYKPSRRQSGLPAAQNEDYLDRHFKPIANDEQYSSIDIDEHVHDEPIRQWSENTGATGRSTIVTNHGSFHKSNLRSDQASVDDIDAHNISCEGDDVSKHVKWDVHSPRGRTSPYNQPSRGTDQTNDLSETANTSARDLFQKYMPVISSDTGFKRPILRRSQAEHEGDKQSDFSKQKLMRRSTANDITDESKEPKKRHSRRMTINAGVNGNKTFDESQLLSAFASIQTPSRMEELD